MTTPTPIQTIVRQMAAHLARAGLPHSGRDLRREVGSTYGDARWSAFTNGHAEPPMGKLREIVAIWREKHPEWPVGVDGVL